MAREDNRISSGIARLTQRDGRQMRSIAIVTMIFLPGTFIAVSCVTPAPFFLVPLPHPRAHNLPNFPRGAT
jgi:hypothetical protein